MANNDRFSLREGKKAGRGNYEKMFNLDILRDVLRLPEMREKPKSISEICRVLNIANEVFYKKIGAITLAQEFLSINQDAPQGVRDYYSRMLEIEQRKIELKGDTKIHIRQARPDMTRMTSPEKNELKPRMRAHEILIQPDKRTGRAKKEKIVQRADGVITQVKEIIKHDRKAVYQNGLDTIEVAERDVQLQAVPATERTRIIDAVRRAYITAKIGDMPNIGDIMISLGIIDTSGKAVKGIDEEEMRTVSFQEGWRDERRKHLFRTFDIIEEELKLTATIRAIDVQKMLFQQLKFAHRASVEYWTKGKITATMKDAAGNEIPLLVKPEPATIGALAEVMRRMTQETGVNIQINQLFANGIEAFESSVTDAKQSLMLKQYAAKVLSMSPDEIEQELVELDGLRELISASHDETLTQDALDAIDVTPAVDKSAPAQTPDPKASQHNAQEASG